MNKYKVLLLDDEAPARELLEVYVDKLDNLELIGTASNALDAKKIIENESVDIF